MVKLISGYVPPGQQTTTPPPGVNLTHILRAALFNESNVAAYNICLQGSLSKANWQKSCSYVKQW